MFIKKLSFAFSMYDRHLFFNHVQMDCVSNALNIIVGDNGVGKSTLFAILKGAADSHAKLEASIILDGNEYDAIDNRMPYVFTQQVHMVYQSYEKMIADQFSFKENLQFACFPFRPLCTDLPNELMLDIALRIGINIHVPVSRLSGGQRQLLAILMALQKRTKLLLLDEPTATLDKYNAIFIMDILAMLAKQLQVTMLIICHDNEIVKRYADRCFVIKKDGVERRIIQEG